MDQQEYGGVFVEEAILKVEEAILKVEVEIPKIGVDIPKIGVENLLFRNVILCQDKLRASI